MGYKIDCETLVDQFHDGFKFQGVYIRDYNAFVYVAFDEETGEGPLFGAVNRDLGKARDENLFYVKAYKRCSR